MTLIEYTTLQDDGCPNCWEHVVWADAFNVGLRGRIYLMWKLRQDMIRQILGGM